MDYMVSPNIGGNLGIIAEIHSAMDCMLLPNIGENLGINAEVHSVMYYMQLPNIGGNPGIITEIHSVMNCMKLLKPGMKTHDIIAKTAWSCRLHTVTIPIWKPWHYCKDACYCGLLPPDQYRKP
jgi:hypothetical protein